MKWNKRLKQLLIALAIVVGISLIAGFLFNCLFSNNLKFRLDFWLLLDGRTYLYALLLSVIALTVVLAYYYKHYWLKNSKKIIQGDERDNDVEANLEQARFQTDEEIDKNYTVADYSELAQKPIVGIPIKAVEHKGKYTVHFAKNAHTMIIGTTGSGKTTTFINPVVQILSQSAAKPSMLISDPKGELYALHAKSLTDKGYTVKVLDLRNPYNSVRWNPLERPFTFYQRMLHLEDEVTADEENGGYIFDGEFYNKPEDLQSALQVKKQWLFDQVYEDLHDMITVLCPITNKNEPIWESGAKNFILAIAIAMLEDSANPQLGMTKEKYNFYNLMKIATNTEDDCAELMKYFQERGPLSKALALSKQVLDSADKTRGSYLSTMFDKLNIFSDLSLCSLTSSNEITFSDMAEQPIALFLQIPDEKETRHTLAAMVLLQAYKELVAKANTYPDLSLPRAVYFLMDEFGNLPPIHKMEQMVTVGRSRNLWLCLVIQSYAQLAKVYDDKVADIIKSNCNIQAFIGTSDYKTVEEFSKRCGNFSVITRNVGYNTVKADDINSNASIKERPLIYPSELSQLNSPNDMGNTIVTVFGYQPIRSKFTPSFAVKAFTLEKTVQRLGVGRYFDEEKIFYDMKRRNSIVIPPRRPIGGRRNSEAAIQQQITTAIDKIKSEADRLITAEILEESKQIELMQLIDRHCFKQAQTIVEEAARHAAAQNFDHLIADLDTLCKRLYQMSRLSGEAQQNK